MVSKQYRKKINTTHTRILPESKQRITNWAIEMSRIQGKRVNDAEVLRRITNIPNMKQLLLRDAEMKRKLSRRGSI